MKDLEIAKLLLEHMSRDAVLALNQVGFHHFLRSLRVLIGESANSLVIQEGLSVIEAWGWGCGAFDDEDEDGGDHEKQEEEDDEAPESRDISGKKGSRDAGEDEKEALAAQIEALSIFVESF